MFFQLFSDELPAKNHRLIRKDDRFFYLTYFMKVVECGRSTTNLQNPTKTVSYGRKG